MSFACMCFHTSAHISLVHFFVHEDNEPLMSTALWRLHPSYQRGYADQLVDCTAKEMKSNSLQLTRVVLMEPFKSRISAVSENMANTPADVISQLLPQSEQVPPRLSESQCDAFHTRRSCSIKHRELFEAPCLNGYSCDPHCQLPGLQRPAG